MNNYVEKIRRGDSLTNFHDVELRETVDNINRELTTDTTTIEGNPINFTTLSAQTAKSTILSLEPIQDLHGYDYPWIAGAGKNKLDVSKFETPSTFTKNNEVFTNNIVDSRDYLNLVGTAGSTIVFTRQSTPTGLFVSDAFTIASDVNRFTVKHSGGIQDLIIIFNQTIPSGSYKFVCTITNNNPSVVGGLVISNCMLILSAEPNSSFAPYSNICPISGRSEIGILGCGVNIWDEVWELGGINGTTGDNIGNNDRIRSKNYIPVIPNTTYYFIYSDSNTTDPWFYICPYGSDKSYLGTRTNIENRRTYTTPNDCYFIRFFVYSNAIQVTTYQNDICINISNQDVNGRYYPYTKSTDLTISLGQTVYGGTLDVENGVLVVDSRYKEFTSTGSETWYKRPNKNIFYTAWTDTAARAPSSTGTEGCFNSNYKCVTKEIDLLDNGECVNSSLAISSSNLSVGARDERYTTTEDFKASLSTPMQIVYPLTTPITINLTPHTINLLKGVNNISTDGDSITLTYRDGKVATLGDLLDLEKKLTDEEPYGFIEHMSILDPAQRIEYIGKNKNYKPMTVNLAGDHLANYNDWHDFFVLKENKPYMIKADGTVDYALDPNDYTKKFDGSASDVTDTTYTGGAFSWIPKIYKYEYVEGSDRYVYLSQKKLNDNYEAVGFIDENGLKHDGVWLPMFYGTEITQDGTVKIMSFATGTPSQSRDTATQKTYIENFSSQAKFFGGPIVNVLADLLIMLGKNSDIQAVFGTGNMSGGNDAQYMKANACLDGGAFYGSSTNTALNKAFHSLVLLTQNQWQRDPYTLCYKGEYIVSPYYKYDLTGASYVNTGVFVTPPSSNNWVYPHKSVSVPHWGAIPVGPYSGSTTTGWADGQYTLATQLTDTTVRVVRRFGGCADGRTGGVRCVHLSNAASRTGWHIGASPLLLSKEKSPN